jgi:UDP-N-acetylmuramoyl-tripeptide--D-alanyl-D-alanine ligase
MNLDVVKAIDAITDFSPLKGRGKVSVINVGKGFDIKLIDDAYNGQPEAMCYALSTLNDIPKNGSRKIAILGKMVELGSITQAEHQRVGQAAANTDIDIIIGVGDETKFILSEIGEDKTKIFKANTEGLYNELIGSILQPNDIVLIKGSHYGSRVFEIADKLLGL